MVNSARRSLDFAARLVALAAEAGMGSAATTWRKSHPRCEQVQHRPADLSMPPDPTETDAIVMVPGT